MREILFRGKLLHDCVWVEGYYLKKTDPLLRSERHFILHQDGTSGFLTSLFEWNSVDPATVGQYTGLTDKNGKKIFEGDVFEFPDEVWESYYTDCGTEYNSWETENRGVVGYCEDYGRVDFVQYLFNENSVDADLHENGNLQFADFVRDLEVIGNIHDNPELLEVDNG